ncbi:MAG: FtsQ-type POTRA domain-containing protein [Nocardioides sp.]
MASGLQTREQTSLSSRRRFARRQWRRRWLVWKYIVAAVLVVALVGGGIYTVYFSSALVAEVVEVDGVDVLTLEDVRAAAEVPLGEPLARVDLEAIELRVESLARVRAAEVTRRWPHDVLIAVEEREVVAVVSIGGRLRGLDRDGVIFGDYRRPPAGLPRVETAIGTSPEALREASAVVTSLPSALVAAVDYIEVETVDQISLVLGDGRIVRWGSSEQSDVKARVLEGMLPLPGRILDVSVPGQPTTSRS